MARLLYIFPVALNLRAHWAGRVKAAAEAGYEVHVAVPDDASLHDLDLGPVMRHDIPERRGGPSPFAELAFFQAVLRLIRRVQPDILHAVTIRPVIYGGMAARFARVPGFVASITGLGYLFIGTSLKARLLRPFGALAYALALRQSGVTVIFENDDDRNLFVRNRLVKRESTHVWVSGGIDLDLFACSPEPATDKPLVVLPGRLLIDKGIREFIEAVRLLRARYAHVRFVLVGDVDPGNPATLSAGEVGDWVKQGLVEHWGWREDMPEIIRSASIICLPSYREGAPMALIEAAATGRAVVATDVPGCRQVVVHGETGLLVPARNAMALAEALARLLADAELRSHMGMAGRAMAEAQFSAARAKERLLDLYQSFAGKA